LQASFNITKTLTISELSEGHSQQLIPARETLPLIVPFVPTDTLVELVSWEMLDELREDGLASVHCSLSATGQEGAPQAATSTLAYSSLGKKLKSKNRKSDDNFRRCYRLAEIKNCCPGH
jgi:hypothetical protein